jgi:outer membrane protein
VIAKHDPNFKVQEFQKRAQEFNQELQGKQKELVDEYMKKISAAT